jgi:hypothetical protein
MYIVQNTIGEVYNDDAMTRNSSFQLTCSVSMRAKKLEKRQDVAGMDKIVHVLLGDLRQIAWIIHICMCEGAKWLLKIAAFVRLLCNGGRCG